jgi:hypothetical protein
MQAVIPHDIYRLMRLIGYEIMRLCSSEAIPSRGCDAVRLCYADVNEATLESMSRCLINLQVSIIVNVID